MPAYILVLLAMVMIDYTAAIYIENSSGERKKHFLLLSIAANVSVLCLFKYYHIMIRTANYLFAQYHITGLSPQYADIILPLGLSFHTFQSMSYIIEVYKGRYKAERHLGYYALYVMFYPQLVAGPIERPQNLLTQLHQHKSFKFENIHEGLRLMLWGLFKKVVIADRVAGYVNPIFNHYEQYHNLQILTGVFAFAIQIYGDFSGYSDIALGAARCMGFRLMVNFKRPYEAFNIRDFWSRWHVSLSSWFRDYVYIPLGGDKNGRSRIIVSVLGVFLLSGMWHGANRTFIAWGLIHALYYLLFRGYRSSKMANKVNFPSWLGWFITMTAVLLSWTFFRAENVSTALLMLQKIFAEDIHFYVFSTVEYFGSFSIGLSIILIAFMFFVESITDPELSWFTNRPKWDILFAGLTLFFVMSFGVFAHQKFIYFQF